jgi:hypothetical protein
MTFACDDPDSLPDKSKTGCESSIRIPPEPPEPEGTVAGVFREIKALFAGKDAARYYTAASRDTGSLTDSVIKSSDHATDLTPALKQLNKGGYRIAIEKVNNSSTNSPAATVTVHWNPELKQGAAGPDIAPGLYRVTAQAADGDPAGEAWIVVASPADFDKKTESLKAVKAQTQSWNQDVPAATVRAVIRATLDQLSR